MRFSEALGALAGGYSLWRLIILTLAVICRYLLLVADAAGLSETEPADLLVGIAALAIAIFLGARLPR